MDVTSSHFPYIIAAYALGAGILIVLTYWVLQKDRKVRQQLAKWQSDAP
ncbi:MAG: hypothetical protein K0R76_1169 [Alphaproteobacteria bacterium]|jgi:heme exporter protein CcmD|nr:hypothetical protein [Alphaproteobacteria bacterium]